jgi:hypothetical protein
LGFVEWPGPFSVGDISPAPDNAPWFVEAMLECGLRKESRGKGLKVLDAEKRNKSR